MANTKTVVIPISAECEEFCVVCYEVMRTSSQQSVQTKTPEIHGSSHRQFLFRTSTCHHSCNTVVPIATTANQKEDSVTTLLCGHRFHSNCVKMWLVKDATCPLCRSKVLVRDSITPLLLPFPYRLLAFAFMISATWSILGLLALLNS